MTTQEKIILIEKLVKHKKEVDAQFQKIFDIFGNNVESELHESVYRMFDSYTILVSDLVKDESEWVPWFIYENDCGKECRVVHSKTKGKNKKKWIVKDVKTLVEVMEDV